MDTPVNELTETEMRAALSARDPRYDDRFVYAVITTGVYCRPSCGARPARPENLRFYSNPEAARAAGFRACRRCRPDQRAPEVERMTELARYIESHADEKLTLAHLAERAQLSASRLQRVFKSVLGVSPKAYQDGLRREELKQALREGERVTDAILEAGYGSPSRVHGAASRNIGMTPSAYRAQGAGETVTWACRDTVLGPLMMAATDRGVCFVQFGESEEELLEQLRSEFARAEIEPSTAGAELDAWIDALDQHLRETGPRPELPLDLRGTAFQVLVWRFLLGLDEGTVVSYAEVARGVGKPRAVRAAASACGANRVAVLVPCHRVLRSDGGLGGYRWGLDRKRALIDAERRRG
ncbi:MAG: methylated-DNA--[protein]-cysteine S-methyltransferase [Myxococcota bacterium]